MIHLTSQTKYLSTHGRKILSLMLKIIQMAHLISVKLFYLVGFFEAHDLILHRWRWEYLHWLITVSTFVVLFGSNLCLNYKVWLSTEAYVPSILIVCRKEVLLWFERKPCIIYTWKASNGSLMIFRFFPCYILMVFIYSIP